MAPFATTARRGAGDRGRNLSRSAPVGKDPVFKIPDGVFKIPDTVLNNLLFRFIHNLPEHERSHELTLMQAAEKAHWYYSDFHCTHEFDEQNDARWRAYPDCKRVKFEPFLQQLFNKCAFGESLKWRVHDLAKNYSLHKQDVPAFGLILFDPSLDYILLVSGYTGKWGFPKGKVNDDEIPIQCAIREVREEIGYDATRNVKKSRHFVTIYRNHTSQCFVALNVPMDYPFKPHVRKEIAKIAWFSLDDLPSSMDQNGNEKCRKIDPSFTCANFVHIVPIVNEIRAYAQKRKKKAQLEPKIRILQRGIEQLKISTDETTKLDEQGGSEPTKEAEASETSKLDKQGGSEPTKEASETSKLDKQGGSEPTKEAEASEISKLDEQGGSEPTKEAEASETLKPGEERGSEPTKEAYEASKPDQEEGGSDPNKQMEASEISKPDQEGGSEPNKQMEVPETPKPLMIEKYVDPFL